MFKKATEKSKKADKFDDGVYHFGSDYDLSFDGCLYSKSGFLAYFFS